MTFQPHGWWNWRVFEINNGKDVVGFSEEMNKIFREIALQVRSFHRAGVYYVNVCNTVQIGPYNVRVYFLFSLAKDHRFREGVRSIPSILGIW